MIYKFNKSSLKYEKLDVELITFSVLTTMALIISFLLGGYFKKHPEKVKLEGGIHIYQEDIEPFSSEAFIELIKETNIKFPHIVYAQALLETGNFESLVFTQNHNLFGMKEARLRCTTAKGTELNHAYYNNWKESLYDYALYQNRYMYKIKNESDYFDALDATYAEVGKQYSKRLKRLIKQEKLEKLFK